MNKTVLFIDDDEIERRSCTDVLKEIFHGTTIAIEGVAPLPTLADYSKMVASDTVAALILDQKLNTAVAVPYSGAELAAHLRAIGSNIPIVILTNYPEEVASRGWAVECIIQKKNILHDPTATPAQEFKARLSRQVELTASLIGERERRFHDLLVKSMKEPLTADEEKELGVLESERLVPAQAEEFRDAKSLERAIEELKAKLRPDKLNL